MRLASRMGMRAPIGLCLLALLNPAAAASQQSASGSLVVILRTPQGETIGGGVVYVVGGQPRQSVDRYGIARFTDLPVGPLRIRAVSLGYRAADTTILIRNHGRDSLQLVLGDEWMVRAQEAQRQQAVSDSMRKANGGIDSLAVGLVQPDTAKHFRFERFGIALLAAAIATTSLDTSRIVSPLSAGQAYGVALLAARDSTARAMAGALRLGSLSPQDLAEKSRAFIAALDGRSDVVLKIANGLWVDTSVTLNPDLQREAQSKYRATARELALSDKSIVPTLNRWADSNTAGRIRAIRDEPYDTTTKVVISNAVYLKSTWLDPFEKAQTAPGLFSGAGGNAIEVPFMRRQASLSYLKGKGHQVVRVPYAAGLTAMYLVLPDSGVPIASLLARFEQDGWPLPNARTNQADVRLKLPRLHVEGKTDLLPVMDSIGMGIARDSMRADFQGLLALRPHQAPWCPPFQQPQPDMCLRMFISTATQHVYLDVDETGTEAAAVTSVGLSEHITSASPPVIDFVVDRPFLFAIRDERSGVMLFVGYLAQPGW